MPDQASSFIDTPTEYRAQIATESWQQRAAAVLRHTVFVDEQRVFADSDRDAIDEDAILLVAIAVAGDAERVVGTVRIHAESPHVWFGSRLAVDPAFRRVHHIGTALIKLAVGIAHARGCTTFLAHVQSQNAPMFARLHWTTLHETLLHGRPHHMMEANLSMYPPIADGERGIVVSARAAA